MVVKVVTLTENQPLKAQAFRHTRAILYTICSGSRNREFIPNSAKERRPRSSLQKLKPF